MGLFTWIIIAVLILSIIGLGWQTFVVGVFKGGEKIIDGNPEKIYYKYYQKYIGRIDRE